MNKGVGESTVDGIMVWQWYLRCRIGASFQLLIGLSLF